MIGTKIQKKGFDSQLYASCADWCNHSQSATIEDMGDFYEVVKLSTDETPQMEMARLQDYLDSTDWMVIKCMERGLDMKYEYPNYYVERQNARSRIDEIRALNNN